ncbi:MAG TPA: carbamoyltransferase HypF, partial [Candidatus Korarchaeota archaeon]|nr:carbamoyltransferase HypF [Candidatus Korarchaeota archaeon]
DRHYRYAFNSCAWCGPRFSMIESVPYDRPNTAMRDFPLCDRCREEYEDPKNVRRFHAQGISCPACGPRLWLEDSSGRRVDVDDPISEAARLIDSDAVIAIKGVGGYHIACLATDDSVIEELRRRKRRPQKPFALMALDLETAKEHAEVDEVAESILTSPERPIVLLPKRAGSPISDLVAPGLDTIGIMLPYTPLHHMLLSETRDKILIMTSGNEHNKPMCTSEEEARRRLSSFVDYFLHHNRRIVHRVDDSVVRFTAGRVTMLRRGRGYAPAWIRLPAQLERPVIAFGAELQTAGAVAFSNKAVLTQFIGDTDEFENLDYMDRTLRFFCKTYDVDPSEAVLVADMHPAYGTRRLAETWAEEYGAEVRLMQHHHAHVASVMVEVRVPLGSRVAGVAVDGLGYGEDGQLWGGEVLVASYGEYERVGHLAPQPMPGGDLATRYPVRMLIGILSTFMSDSEVMELLSERDLLSGLPRGETEARIAVFQARDPQTPKISSVGRTLDAISALLGLCFERTYEGEPAMKLEAAARGGRSLDGLEAPLRGRGVIDASRLVEALIERIDSFSVADLAFSAIHAIGLALGELAAKAASSLDANFVVVSGGAAVNSILIEGMEEALKQANLELRLNSKVPPGDGGIALGQVALALALEE